MRGYLDGGKWELAGEFAEVETGKRADRPEFEKAIATAKKHRARLVIAKLDQLSRDVAFISALMERKVDFIAVDNPYATKFNIHILSALAKLERNAISKHTKARRVELGNYARISAANQAATATCAESVRSAIEVTADMTANAAATRLNKCGITTAAGDVWRAEQILRARHQLGL